MEKIISLDKTNYKVLLDYCFSSNDVSKMYLAAHKQKPLIKPKIKVKVIDISKYPKPQKQRYTRLLKKILFNYIRPYYQNLHNRSDLTEDIFKVYQLIDQKTQQDKQVYCVLNQYHKGEQLRKSILKNNQCFQDPKNVKNFGKQILWNIIKGGGIQNFLYTSTNTIIDDIRLQLHTNCASTTGVLFIESVLDSIRSVKKYQESQAAKKINKEGQSKQSIKEIQIQKKYQQGKTISKEEFLEVYPFLHKNILELPKNGEDAIQRQIKQKIRNFASLYLMLITRKDINLKVMELIENDHQSISLHIMKDKLNRLQENYKEFLQRQKIVQRIKEYEQKIKVKQGSLKMFFENILAKDEFSLFFNQKSRNIWTKTQYKKCYWRKIYQICGFLQQGDSLQDQLFVKMHQNLFQFQPDQYFYRDRGILDPLFYLPIKYNLNFILLTVEDKHWYSCFQAKEFSTQAMIAINNIKSMIAIEKQRIMDKISEQKQLCQIGMTEIRSKVDSRQKISLAQKTKKQEYKRMLQKTTLALQYLNQCESRFFLKRDEYNIVFDQKLQRVTYYLPNEIYMSNFSYLYF